MTSRRIPADIEAAILADYAAGLNGTQIAAKYGVSNETVYRRARAAGISRGRAHRDINPDGLAGGRWVLHQRRRILIWQETAA